MPVSAWTNDYSGLLRERLPAFRAANADDPDARAQELTDEYNANFANPDIAEARGFLDAVVEPAETRRVLLRGLNALIGKREELPYKRNGNVPL